jgi:hypothetical protein
VGLEVSPKSTEKVGDSKCYSIFALGLLLPFVEVCVQEARLLLIAFPTLLLEELGEVVRVAQRAAARAPLCRTGVAFDPLSRLDAALSSESWTGALASTGSLCVALGEVERNLRKGAACLDQAMAWLLKARITLMLIMKVPGNVARGILETRHLYAVRRIRFIPEI